MILTVFNQIIFRSFLEHVLPEEIDQFCAIFIEYNERDIQNYRIENIVLF